jgi:hypothetical protein
MVPAPHPVFLNLTQIKISPRPGSRQHHLTVRAAAQLIHLLGRGQLAKDLPRAGDG